MSFKTKVSLFIGVLCLLISSISTAAPVSNVPTFLTQPDGSIIHVLSSGDEFYNWLHDEDGYTIIEHPKTGYYVYADKYNGFLKETDLIVGTVDPLSTGLETNLLDPPEYRQQIANEILSYYPQKAKSSSRAPKTGTLHNLVVFIKFSGESEFTNSVSYYDEMYNSKVSGKNSAYNFYQEFSYEQLNLETDFFPKSANTTVASYTDTYARGYFYQKSSSYPNGYNDSQERAERETELLSRIIIYLNTVVDSSADFDGDNDGKIDNVTIIVKGNAVGWQSLLWPHRWYYYGYEKLHGKKIWDFNLLTEDLTTAPVICHEMFHTVGAPDLYRYDQGSSITPIGVWDLMASTDHNYPQHSNAYMKSEYAGWLSLTTITDNGTFTLSPLYKKDPVFPQGYKVASPNSNSEYYVIEYRKKEGLYENSLPGEGLLIYRINPAATHGNMEGPPDEVYVFRPNGTNYVTGNINDANFSSSEGRTVFNQSTNPKPYLSNGNSDGLNIYDIGAAGETITFSISGIGCFIQCGASKNCGPDGCGGVCGYCTKHDGSYCDETAGQCKCTKKTCTELNADCGNPDDGCGGKLNCGECTDFTNSTCVSGKCQCTADTCDSKKYNCGDNSDGCGGIISCGKCDTYTNSECKDGVCTCEPDTCEGLGFGCGEVDDGCGGKIDCGVCNDDNNCTKDICENNTVCKYDAASMVDTACNDDNPCTLEDRCGSDAKCVGNNAPTGTPCDPNMAGTKQCMLGECVDAGQIIIGDTCSLPTKVSLGPPIQNNMAPFTNSFSPDVPCVPRKLDGPDLFVALDASPGRYMIKAIPYPEVDVSIVMLGSCDPTTCKDGVDNFGKGMEEIYGPFDITHLAPAPIFSIDTVSKDVAGIVSVELIEVLPPSPDGDADDATEEPTNPEADTPSNNDADGDMSIDRNNFDTGNNNSGFCQQAHFGFDMMIIGLLMLSLVVLRRKQFLNS